MVIMNNQIYSELGILSQKIEDNTASVQDYNRYEELLLNAGLQKEYILSYLKKADLKSWEDLIKARNKQGKLREENQKMNAVGGLLGIAIGLFVIYLIGDERANEKSKLQYITP